MSQQPAPSWKVEMRPDGPPRTGDVIICRMDQTSQTHALRVMPRPLQLTYPTYIEALISATNFAALDGVDVWLEQHESSVFVLVERNRPTALRHDVTDRGPDHEATLDPSFR